MLISVVLLGKQQFCPSPWPVLLTTTLCIIPSSRRGGRVFCADLCPGSPACEWLSGPQNPVVVGFLFLPPPQPPHPNSGLQVGHAVTRYHLWPVQGHKAPLGFYFLSLSLIPFPVSIHLLTSPHSHSGELARVLKYMPILVKDVALL